MNTRKTGSEKEQIAAAYLKRDGYELVEQNYRCRFGEIDLIARKDGYLIFVEVKYRSGGGQGGAFAAVDYRKQKIISRVALQYMCYRKLPDDIPCRFDVVAITGERIEHMANAFDFCG